MKRVLGTILFVIYAIIAIAVTVLLLSYNDYNNSVIGDYTVYIVKDDSLEPEYKQGSILLIKETNDRNVQVGDKIFMYKVLNSSEYEVVNTTLQGKTQQGNHVVYLVDNDERYANEYFIGKVDDTIVIEGWGYILNLLESRWGYLFCIVVVSLLLFLQEVFELVMEIKYLNKQKKKSAIEIEAEEYEDDDYDEYDEDDEYDEYEEDEEEEPVVKPRTKKTTKKATTTSTARSKASTSTRAKSSASTSTRTRKSASTSSKTNTAKKTGTTRKTSTAKTTGTTTKRKTATTTRKPRTTKSSKEEE